MVVDCNTNTCSVAKFGGGEGEGAQESNLHYYIL